MSRIGEIKSRYINDPDLLHKLKGDDIEYLLRIAEKAYKFAFQYSVMIEWIPECTATDEFNELKDAIFAGEEG